MRTLLAFALLLLAPTLAAQQPRVLFDTDRGPLLLELDATRAPGTTANFLRYVDDGVYNATLFQRIIRDFVVQGGGVRENYSAVARRAPITNERNNGLRHVPGSIAMALSGNPPNVNSATSDFFINTGTNTNLDGDFTVFGRVIFGLRTLEAMDTTPVFAGTDIPIRAPLLKRAARVAPGEFPILPLHSGTWFDPDKSGRGFLVEFSQVSGSETGPLLVVAWYDYFEGEQIWMSGVAPIQWGTSAIEVPLQITRGAQFGDAFDPADVERDNDWGRVTIRFTGCDAGVFSYTSRYGDGNVEVRSLTSPAEAVCSGN